MAARGHFSNRFGFIAAAAGSAVGLGNIWKFPFETGKNGGAAFVLIYLVFCFLLCFPVMISEIAIGRKTQRNPVGAFNALGFRKWNIVGKLGVLSGILILSFYNVVAGWALGYFFQMLAGNFAIGGQFEDFIKEIGPLLGYALMFMLTTAFIVSKGIASGIEKASKIMMPALVVIILGLAIYAFTLPDAMTGVKFYLQPDFTKINFSVIYGALGQAFFSLSLGMGALMTYGSYLNKNDNIVSSAVLITIADVGIAFLAGLMMFPFVAYLNHGDMSAVEGGAGLIFSTLPGVFQSLGPVMGIVVGATFFLLLSFASLTSTVSLLEVPVAYMVDEHKIARPKAVWFMALLIFVIGIPSMLSNGYSGFLSNFITYIGNDKATSFMDFVAHISSDTFLPLGGFLITVFTAYVWKTKNLSEEIGHGYPGYHGSLVSKFINISVLLICPVVLGFIFLFTVLSRFFGIDLAFLG